MNNLGLWKMTAVLALGLLVTGLVLTVYDWDYLCSASQFRHDIIVATASFVSGITFEMVTGFFGKTELPLQPPHYGK